MTGHRLNNAQFRNNATAIGDQLAAVLAAIVTAIAAAPRVPGQGPFAAPRLHTLLADGTDALAARLAAAQGFEIVAPLPFGPELARKVAAAGAPSAEPEALSEMLSAAHVFALGEQDARLRMLFEAPDDPRADGARFSAEASHRYALAARVVIAQSDLLIAVWDGVNWSEFGGTGHTIAEALAAGVPVLWIPPQAPDTVRLLTALESLGRAAGDPADSGWREALAGHVRAVLCPGGGRAHAAGHAAHGAHATHGAHGAHEPAESAGLTAFVGERWKPESPRLLRLYRRIEALFADPWPHRALRSLAQRYETPEEIARGSWAAQFAALSQLPGLPPGFALALETAIARRFAWTDGLATHLADAYRSGQILIFLLSAVAGSIGLAYLPFASANEKWIFALVEVGVIALILGVTFAGTRRRWHQRWFEIRRAAEYLRHGLISAALGVARPAGRWLKGLESSWPEWYARHALREVGLPPASLSEPYLRQALGALVLPLVTAQRDYHRAKAARLARVHHNLDTLSTVFFVAAIASVTTYLALKLIDAASGSHITDGLSKLFTFLGVVLPILGATGGSIRYFGDFERFAVISRAAEAKLDALAERLRLLVSSSHAITYDEATRIVQAMDAIVSDEIEAWQSVFSGKHITIPA